MSESFEYGVPPPGWTKTNLLGGSGWYQLPIGTMPLPGWGNGTSSVPTTANAGTHNAYCSWNTGGGAGEGYHNDQWLISPRLTGLTATSTVSYWLRFNFTNFPDTVYFRVSTNGPAPANFTFIPLTNVFARASYSNQFPPWSNHVVNVGALGIPAGTPIWIAIHEYEWDNVHNGAAIQLDVIDSDLTAPPEARTSPTSLVFTAYYDGADPAPQTFALRGVGSSGFGYASAVAFGAGPTSWLSVAGPASGTLGFQGSQVYTASVSVAGLDLGTYVATNVFTVPGATNTPLRVPITLHVIRRPQAISFSNPGPQYTTNRVGLAGTASSGLQVTFSVFSGPGSIVGATNLSFTGTGTVKVVAWQLGNVYYDVAPCVTQSMAVTKPSAAIEITDLSHVYDGAPHGATVTTVPEGLAVVTTYDGGAALPVAIGSYAVTSVVDDVLYGGLATATYTITRMPQTVDFPDPGAQWTTGVVGLAATASSGLPVTFSVASGPGTISGGTNLSFTGAGTVRVVAAQAGDADWLPAAATNDLAVAKVAATVALGSLAQTYDGAPKSATATTDPAGLAVEFTYDGSGTAPTAAGSYAVTGTIHDAFYHGSDSGTLTIGQGTADVYLLDLERVVDGTPRNVTATTMPAGLAVEFTYDGSTNAPLTVGSYAVTGTVADANWQGSSTGTLAVGKGTATVTLENLSQAYDGSPKPATATTAPTGLVVELTYDGSATAPSAVGSYAVTGTVADANWQGTNVGTLAIGKGTATIAFDDLTHVYDGTAKSATATTVPDGLPVEITYDGSATAPSAVGSYAVTGTVNDANWQGTNTATLTIGKAAATVELADLLHAYDGTAKSATATTDPAGLAVDLTYDGSAAPPTAAGSYSVTGTVNEANWMGSATGTLVIAKAAATVELADLLHVYDGTAKSATATTDPAGLAVDLTYDGVAVAPTAAGSYSVTGTVNEANWRGAASGTLVIEKAAATVTLGDLVQTYTGTPRPATATTVPAGLAVDLTYDGSAAAPTAVGAYAVTGTVVDANHAGEATGMLTIEPRTVDLKINCGGPALAGGWSADTGFVGGGVWKTGSSVANATAAPMAVYQSERSSKSFRYDLPAVPNGAYRVTLHFSEMAATAAGLRIFHVAIEGARVVTNLDVFAAAGGTRRALVRSFDAEVSDGNGLQIDFTGVKNNAEINGIEIASTGPPAPAVVASLARIAVPEGGSASFGVKLLREPAAPTTVTVARVSGDGDIRVSDGSSRVFTPENYAVEQTVVLAADPDDDAEHGSAAIRCEAPGHEPATVTATEQDDDSPPYAVRINCGGAALSGGWGADAGSVGGSVWKTRSTVASATEAPMAVYQSERSAKTFRYDLPDVPDGTYRVKLHFSEMAATAAGLRVFHVSIEGTRVLSFFDVFAAAGGKLRATTRTFDVEVSDGNGLQIDFTGVKNNAEINGIEVDSAARGSAAAGDGIRPRPVREGDPMVPDVVRTSEDPANPGAGMAAVDGDPETVWTAGGREGAWICLGYARPVSVGQVEIRFTEESPQGFQVLASEDAADWFELEPELEFGPVGLNYLWFLFPADPLAPPPAVREIEVRETPAP